MKGVDLLVPVLVLVLSEAVLVIAMDSQTASIVSSTIAVASD